MNAVEQVKDFRTASKVAALVNVFKLQFPHLNEDLKPWRDDPNTQKYMDPTSIDIGLHFPCRNPSCQSRSLLVQIHFNEDPGEKSPYAVGVEALGFDHQGQQWEFSTVDNWTFVGDSTPLPEGREKLKSCCRQIFELFNSSV